MKVKIGDKLKVKSDLELGKEYGNIHVTSEMLQMAGQLVTVSHVGPNYIHIHEDENDWYWGLRMFDRCD